jgi:hypothetical protein
LVVYANSTKNKANAVKTQFGRKSFKTEPEPEEVSAVDDSQCSNIVEVEENRVEIEDNHVEYTVEEVTEFDEGQEIDLKTKYNFPLKTADEIIEMNEKVRDDPDCARDVVSFFAFFFLGWAGVSTIIVYQISGRIFWTFAPRMQW